MSELRGFSAIVVNETPDKLPMPVTVIATSQTL
jgi:hypothetical protein